MSAGSSSGSLDRAAEARSFYRLLGTRPRNDKAFNRALEILGLTPEKSKLLEDDAYRAAFREQLRLGLLLREAMKLCPLGVELLETQGRLEFLRHIEVDALRAPYRFVLNDDYMGWNTLHVRLELRNNPAFRQALLARYYQQLPKSVQRLRQALAILRVSFHELMSRPGSMRTELFLSQDPHFMAAAFEMVGSPPLGFNGDLYDLPSLVEHYCALFGHNAEQEEYLRQHGKRVYLEQLSQQAQLDYDGKSYGPTFLDKETLRLQFRRWTRQRQQPGQVHRWPLVAHYIQQAFLLGETYRQQGWDMLLEFVFVPLTAFNSVAWMPGLGSVLHARSQKHLTSSKEILDKVLQGLSYDSAFLEEFDQFFSHWAASRLDDPNLYQQLMRMVSFPAEDVVTPNRIDSLKVWLRWNPMLTNYSTGHDLRVELLRAAVYNHYDMFMLLLDRCDLALLDRITEPSFLSQYADLYPSRFYRDLIYDKMGVE